MQYVYVLMCVNNQTYVGCTENLKERLERHNNGYVPATKNLRPVKLIWYGCFENKYLAFNFEKYLKTGSGRVLLKKRLIVSKDIS
jgi:putative endonuclease